MPELQTRERDRFDLKALYDTSRLLSASLDLGFVLNNLLLTAMSKLFVTRGIALIYDAVSGQHQVATAKGLPDLKPGDTLKIGSIPPDRLLQGDEIPTALAERKIKLILPVSYSHREIGLLGLSGKATGAPFERAELEFIQSLVNMSSAAVHNSILVAELKTANRDLDSRIQQLDTLFELSQAFNATIDRAQLVKLLSFTLMAHTLVGKYIFLMRRMEGMDTEEEPRFYVVHSKGMPDPELPQDILNRICSQEVMVLLDEREEWQDLRELGIALVVPLRTQNATCGALCLGPKMTGLGYEPADLEFLYSLGNLAFVSLRNADLIEEQIEKERLEQELSLARDIQRRLLPQSLPQLEDVDVAATAMPSREVGGDYFEVTELENNRLLVAVGDVTGKGMPAALLMANLQACLHILLPMDLTLEEATAHMNRVICGNTGYDKFITYFHGIYHRATRELHYVNAGHNPPMLIRRDGTLELLETGGLLLGVLDGLTFDRGSVQMQAEDVLALFTDGVTEAMNASDEEYGEERLLAVLQRERSRTATEIFDAVLDDIRAFTGELFLRSDDLTLIVMKVR